MIKNFVTFNKPPVSARERKLSRFMLFFEDVIKVPLFHCQRCGECILSSTGFICCQNCPKRLRNGPCGGTGADGSCEVYPEKKCVWYRIYHSSKRLRRMSLLYKVNKIHNWELEGTSAWLNVFKKRIDGIILFVRHDKEKVKEMIADVIQGKD